MSPGRLWVTSGRDLGLPASSQVALAAGMAPLVQEDMVWRPCPGLGPDSFVVTTVNGMIAVAELEHHACGALFLTP